MSEWKGLIDAQGKSLSLICSSLTWLRNHKREIYQIGLVNISEGKNLPFYVGQVIENLADENEPDWMIEHALKEKREAALHRQQELEARLARIRENERKAKQRHSHGEGSRKRAVGLSLSADSSH